jgi:hypothetical protein
MAPAPVGRVSSALTATAAATAERRQRQR